MARERVLTALCLGLFLTLLLFFLPIVIFDIFIVVMVLIGAWEWANLSGFKGILGRCGYLCLLLLCFFLTAYWARFSDGHVGNIAAVQAIVVMGCLWWALALLWVQGYPSSALLWGSPALRAVMGLLVLVPAAVALIYLRLQPQGEWLIFLVITVVVLTDVGAYYVGSA